MSEPDPVYGYNPEAFDENGWMKDEYWPPELRGCTNDEELDALMATFPEGEVEKIFNRFNEEQSKKYWEEWKKNFDIPDSEYQKAERLKISLDKITDLLNDANWAETEEELSSLNNEALDLAKAAGIKLKVNLSLDRESIHEYMGIKKWYCSGGEENLTPLHRILEGYIPAGQT